MAALPLSTRRRKRASVGGRALSSSFFAPSVFLFFTFAKTYTLVNKILSTAPFLKRSSM